MILHLQTVDFQSVWSGWTSDDVLRVFRLPDVETAHGELMDISANVQQKLNEIIECAERITVQRRRDENEMESLELFQFCQEIGNDFANCGVSF